ncbi:MAG TPA: zinc ribbon domain-containing protein, partial [Mycobacterium sp.]
AADRPDHLHCRTTTHGAQSRTQGQGAAAGAGSVAAQYQLRPVRSLTTAAGPCGPPRRGRVVPKRVLNPGGPRHARADGVPLRGHRHDCLSRRYNRVRADHAAESGRASQAKQARAQQMAARIVATHGNVITVEDCRISTWARLWGTRIALVSPGMLVAALKRECAATGGQLYRAGTHFTALSQHCLCGARVPKSLSQRTHACPHCGLHGDRDVISAILAACVDIADPDDPRTARVDYRLAHALRRGWPPSKSGRAQSTGTSHQQYPLPDRPGPAATTQWPLLSKQHSATPEQTRPKVWTSRDQPENTAPQAVWRSMTHYGSTLRRWTARCRRGCRAR